MGEVSKEALEAAVRMDAVNEDDVIHRLDMMYRFPKSHEHILVRAKNFDAFAAAAVAREREACADRVDALVNEHTTGYEAVVLGHAADSIRSRGEAPSE